MHELACMFMCALIHSHKNAYNHTHIRSHIHQIPRCSYDNKTFSPSSGLCRQVHCIVFTACTCVLVHRVVFVDRFTVLSSQHVHVF